MPNHPKQELSRRSFLRQVGCAGLGSTTLYSLLLNLAMSSRAAAQDVQAASPYRALVCLFLEGGNDSFNMLTPLEDGEFARYQAARADLALARADLLRVTDPAGSTTGRAFGLHPGMPELRDLYQDGKLSFVCNVGTLVERTDLAAINQATARLPLGLYSHADQVMHWHTGMPDIRGTTGWAGRAAELLQDLNTRNDVAMNVSLSGTNLLQSGRDLIPYSITPDGVSLLNGYTDPARPFLAKAVDSMLEQQQQNLLKQTYAQYTRRAIDSSYVFLDAWNAVPPLSAAFPATGLGARLRAIAHSIAMRDALGHRRQTYFVRFGGWDHHDEVIASQAGMLAAVSAAVGAFWRALIELGVQDDVLLFSASDFGRTLSSNGKGSDHGWGGNQFVLGGAHRGGRFYGRYPDDLSLGNGLDTGRGRLIPTTSVDEYICELALWLGVSPADMPLVVPNIDRFFHLGSGTPLGFFG